MSTHQTSAVRSLAPGEQPLDWRQRGACRNEDPDLFFPVGDKGPALLQIKQAKKVCQGCSVRTECLAEALRNEELEGVWAGLTEVERRAMNQRTRATQRRAS